MASDRSKLQSAAQWFEQGVTQAQVARRLGVSRVTAMRWYRRWTTEGSEGLLRKRRVGRKRRLSASHAQRLCRALAESPKEYGFEMERWSLASIAAWIEREAAIRYHPNHVGRLLKRLGWIIPPVGEQSNHALRSATFHDCDGNPIQLQWCKSRSDG